MKYWDIIPPKKKKLITIQDVIDAIGKGSGTPMPYKYQPTIRPIFPEGCLHNGCDHARNPICMLSCPCRSCSPMYLCSSIGMLA